MVMRACMMSVALVWLSLACVAGAAIPVIIDTDIGQDFDDSWAISVSLASPDQMDIKLILTAAHNATGRAQILCKFLQAINRTDIAVGIGLSQDNYVGPLYGWAQDYNLNSYPGKLYTDGIGAAIDIINSSPTPVTIMEIAPLGNLQKMLSIQPSIAEKANIVAMAGSVYKCYGGAPGPCPEYNIFENVPASQAVYNATWNTTITPLDTCGLAIVNGSTYQTFLAANNSDHPLVQTLLMNYVYWHDHGNSPFDPSTSSTVLYDAVAAYLVYSDRSLVNMQTFKLNITDNGTMVVSVSGKVVDVAITWTTNGLIQWEEQIVARIIKYQGPSS